MDEAVERPGAGPHAARQDRSRIWGAVLLLTLVGVVNLIDRSLPAVLFEPIKRDLHLSDTALGLINGFGFLLVYALAGVPIARIADRGAYGLVVSTCVALWSLMTLLGSAAQVGWHLFVTRLGVALGEAGNSPASHAYVARNFPAGARAAPLAVLTLSNPAAVLLSNAVGGVLGEMLGWRLTFAMMGVIGIVLAVVVILVLGPRQEVVTSGPPPSFSLKPALALLKKPSFLLIVAGSALVGVGGYSLGIFSGAFLMRVHGMGLAEMGLKYGLVAGVASVVSIGLAGVMADRLSRKDPRWLLWTLVVMIGVLGPCVYAAFLVSGAWPALILMSTANIIGAAYLAPVIAAIQRLSPPELRATASALLLMFTALAGGLGPFLTGMISDLLEPSLGVLSLARAMLVVPVAYTIAGFLYLAATVTFRRDLVAEAP